MDACGYGTARFNKFYDCTKKSLTVPEEENDKYYTKTSSDMMAFLKGQKDKVNKKKISEKTAYKNISNFCNQKTAEEQQANDIAKVVGVAAVITVAAIACSNTHCLDGRGGGGGGYNSPLLCSQDLSGSPQCYSGKACGNTCIRTSDVCRVGAGTACNITPKPYP